VLNSSATPQSRARHRQNQLLGHSPGTGGPGRSSTTPGTNAVPSRGPSGTDLNPDADGILHADGACDTGSSHKSDSDGRGESNGNLGPNERDPINGAPQHHANSDPDSHSSDRPIGDADSFRPVDQPSSDGQQDRKDELSADSDDAAATHRTTTDNQGVHSGSNDSDGPPPGQNGRKRNPIIDRCLAEARQAITNTEPQLDLFSYAR